MLEEKRKEYEEKIRVIEEIEGEKRRQAEEEEERKQSLYKARAEETKAIAQNFK